MKENLLKYANVCILQYVNSYTFIRAYIGNVKNVINIEFTNNMQHTSIIINNWTCLYTLNSLNKHP